jgi:hypothetical protein
MGARYLSEDERAIVETVARWVDRQLVARSRER